MAKQWSARLHSLLLFLAIRCGKSQRRAPPANDLVGAFTPIRGLHTSRWVRSLRPVAALLTVQYTLQRNQGPG